MAIAPSIIGTARDVDKRTGKEFVVSKISLACDGSAGDSDIVALDATHHIGITGIHGLPPNSGTFIIKSAATVLTTYEFLAHQFPDYRHSEVIWWTEINEALKMNVTSGTAFTFDITIVKFLEHQYIPKF